MLHLLTEEHRQKVVAEYNKRVTIVFLIGVVVVVVLSAVFLMPIFLMSHGRYSEVLAKKEALSAQMSVKSDDASSQGVREMVASLDALHEFDSQKDIAGIISSIVGKKPNGIQLKNFIFSPAEDNSLTVDVGGRASTRQSLLSFNEIMKQNPQFVQVNIPLSSFAKDKDIDFFMKITVSSSTSPIAQDSIQDAAQNSAMRGSAVSSLNTASTSGSSTASSTAARGSTASSSKAI